MQQAARVSDFTAFFYKGHIIEFGDIQKIFTNPANKKTEEYYRPIWLMPGYYYADRGQ